MSSPTPFYATLLIILIHTIFVIGFYSLSISFLSSGVRKRNYLKRFDPSKEFEYLGQVCEITLMNIDSKTYGLKSGKTCKDTVSYTFILNDDNDNDNQEATSYNSQTVTSMRNSGKEGPDDRCDGNGLQPYRGSYLKDGSPFACKGRNCNAGDMVDCWQPTVIDDCSKDGGCNVDDYSWANCGNMDCKKLVDPQIVWDIAMNDARQEIYFGSGVLVGFTIFCCVWIRMACGPINCKKLDSRELQEEAV